MIALSGKVLIGGLVLAAGFKTVDVALPEIRNVLASGSVSIESSDTAPLPALATESDKAEPVEEVAAEVEAKVCEPVPDDLLFMIEQERELIAVDRDKADTLLSEADLAREKIAIETAQLEELKAEIGGMLAKVEAAHTDDVDRLISFYSQMKPNEAALIMDDLDLEVTVMVLGTMAEREAAPIMAKMSPVRARAISKILFERSKLPGDQKLNGIRLR
jgi:flagellar motility protein MotE (MotC chaperone)